MEFINKKSLEELIKEAQVEVLLSSITIDKKGPLVHPVKCPAVGRKNDYLMDANKEPVCIFNGNQCKYFVSTEFSLEDYTKIIICDAVNIDDVKGQ
jgi:hypothetical protein